MKTDPLELVIDLLSQQTARDKQVSIGASNASNPCTRCLADDMLGVPHERGRYFMGSVIGTAVHMLLEERAAQFPDELETELRVELGEIDGYGTVKSTTDLFIKETGVSVDFKTTTRAKLVFLKRAHATDETKYDTASVDQARFTVQKYLTQLKLYGLGLVRAGYKVTGVCPVYIARDALTAEPDSVWAPDVVRFDLEEAEAIFTRVQRLWGWLQDGGDPDTLTSHPQCYHCNNNR